MQDSRTAQFSLSRKKTNSTPKQPLTELPRANDGPPSRIGRKVSVSMGAVYNSDSSSGNEYRAVRRKYLVLEEEGFALERELKKAEDEVKALENEKIELLDQLVVLEGLIDPSESHHFITDSVKITS